MRLLTLCVLRSLPTSQVLSDTCAAYLDCCNTVSKVAWEHRTISRETLHQLVYRRLRGEYHVGAQMAQSSIIRVIGNYRTIKEAHGSPWAASQPEWEVAPAQPQRVAGVDMGVRFLATTYDSEGRTVFYDGKEAKRRREHYKKLRASLQKKWLTRATRAKPVRRAAWRVKRTGVRKRTNTIARTVATGPTMIGWPR